MRRRALLGVLPAMISLRPAFGAPSPQSALDELSDIIEHSFPDVTHLGIDPFVRMLEAAPDDVVILDVRGSDEFAVSRIERAIWVDPAAKSTAPIFAAAGPIRDKTVVAYCSIGLRSARLLVRIGQSLKDRGPKEVFNLRGGLFKWRNDGRVLTSGDGATRRIHPYSAAWRQYLADSP